MKFHLMTQNKFYNFSQNSSSRFVIHKSIQEIISWLEKNSANLNAEFSYNLDCDIIWLRDTSLKVKYYQRYVQIQKENKKHDFVSF